MKNIKYIILLLLFFSMKVMAQSNFDKAEKYFKEGNYVKAKPLFIDCFNDNPTNVKVIEYLGDIEGHLHSWDNALIYYKKLKKLNPNEANYYYKYGGVLGMIAKESNPFKALGMVSEVKTSFVKCLKLNPKHIEVRWALIELYLQLPGIAGGSESKANRYAKELYQLSPVDGYLANGHIAEYFKRYKEAEKQYKLAIKIAQSKTSSIMLSSLYKNKMNRPEDAKIVLENYERNKG